MPPSEKAMSRVQWPAPEGSFSTIVEGGARATRSPLVGEANYRIRIGDIDPVRMFARRKEGNAKRPA